MTKAEASHHSNESRRRPAKCSCTKAGEEDRQRWAVTPVEECSFGRSGDLIIYLHMLLFRSAADSRFNVGSQSPMSDGLKLWRTFDATGKGPRPHVYRSCNIGCALDGMLWK